MKTERTATHRWRRVAVTVLFALALTTVLAACAGKYEYPSVTFADPQNGWVTGWNATTERSVVSKTTDGGATWTPSGSRKVQAHIVGWVEFSSPTTGVWCCDVNKILYTTTGGAPWRKARVRGFSGHFMGASFVDAKVGWACGISGVGRTPGVVAKTGNAGRSWTIKLRTPRKARPGGFVDIVATGSRSCLALKTGARAGVWATADGGKTWTRRALPGATRKSEYAAIAFPTPLIGWAVGADGKIAKTTDGGLTWTAQVSGVATRLNGVCFRSADLGFAVGAGGVILATADGGATWTPQVSGTTVDLFSVDFASDTEGWVVATAGWAPGQAGTLLHTTDGGLTWH